MSKQLNEADRVAICHKKRENPDIMQAQLVKWVKENIWQVSYSRNDLQHAQALRQILRQRQRKVSYPELEECLFEWILKFQHTGQLSGETLKIKAAEIASRLYPGAPTTLQFSAGWLEKFKKRHGI